MIQGEAADFYNNSEDFLRNISVDNVIFGYHYKKLKVLLCLCWSCLQQNLRRIMFNQPLIFLLSTGIGLLETTPARAERRISSIINEIALLKQHTF